MADIRINSLPSTATSFNADDYIAIDGASAGTRKMLAANPPFTDVTLGASGPSVKSTLSARAPRQGLVFDGTAGAYSGLISGPSTNDFTLACWVNPASFAASGYLFGNSRSNSIYVGVRVATGAVFSGLSGGSAFGDTLFSLASGKMQLLVRVRSGSTALWYLNGVLVQSGVSDSNNYSGAFEYYGSANSSAAIFTGTLIPLIYNRALSAAEVVALYEAGAPAAADYNTASNTNLSASAFTNYNTTSFTGVSATGFTAVSSAACEIDSNPNFSLAVGQRIRATFSITVNSGTVQSVLAEQGVGAKSATSATFSTGTYSIELVATGSSSNAAFVFSSVGASNFSVSNFSAVRAGLVLAPDAAQAGGGSVWYDTSGNAANITLPASGVSWNVPTSGKINNALAITNTTASTSTSSGALVVSGGVGVAKDLYVGGTVITLQPGSGTTAPQQKIIGPSGATYGPSLFLDASASTSGKVYIVGSGLSGDNGGLGSFYVYDVSAANSVLKIVGGNTTLAGTLAVSGNTNAFGAGGTGGANSQLIIEGGSAANGGGAILYRKNGTVKAYAGMESSILGGGSSSDNYIIYTSSGLALTVAGQQVQANATTASTSTSTGALVVSGGVGVAKEVYVGKTCKVGTGSDNEGYTNVFTNKAENTAGPFDITLPSDCVGVVFLNSYQGGVGRSFREIPFICFGGTVTLGTSRTTVLTADPVTSVAAAASSKITISLYAANTNCYWGIYVNKS